MVTVRQLLTEKGNRVLSVVPDSTVFDAIRKMADENVGCLVVCEGDRPVGIVTERHYARNVVLRGRGSPTTKVREIMDTDVLYARPDQTVEECMAVMTDKRVRHLPVLDEGKLVGLISIGDLVKAIIGDQQFLIDQLVQYLHS
jgi:CBS domain-containing protein